MVEKQPKDAGKPRVVYDIKMPAYGYRDERGEARTVDVSAPKAAGLKLDCLANLTLSN